MEKDQYCGRNAFLGFFGTTAPDSRGPASLARFFVNIVEMDDLVVEGDENDEVLLGFDFVRDRHAWAPHDQCLSLC